jgi:hypothetical protein
LLGLALYYLIYICIFLWTDIWYAWYHQFPF